MIRDRVVIKPVIIAESGIGTATDYRAPRPLIERLLISPRFREWYTTPRRLLSITSPTCASLLYRRPYLRGHSFAPIAFLSLFGHTMPLRSIINSSSDAAGRCHVPPSPTRPPLFSADFRTSRLLFIELSMTSTLRLARQRRLPSRRQLDGLPRHAIRQMMHRHHFHAAPSAMR